MYGNQRNDQPPVREGDEIDVRIESVGGKGDGIAKKNGFVLFIPNVKKGDEVRIRITKVLPKNGFAEVIGEPKEPIPEDRPARRQHSRRPEIKPIQPPKPSPEDSEDFGEIGDDASEEEDSESEDMGMELPPEV